jgi:rhomboid protease GluP
MQPQQKNKFREYYKFHPVTTIILAINLVMAIILIVTGGFDTENLVKFGALVPILVTEEGEYYRIITAMFLHGGFLHLLSNSFVLYYIGAYMERLVGPKKYLLIYMISGIISSLFVLFLASDLSVTIGASGAIFGVIGGLLVLTFLRKEWFSDHSIRTIRQLIIINVVITFLLPTISIPGHMGGLIAGILIGYLMAPKSPYYYKNRKSVNKDNTIYQA